MAFQGIAISGTCETFPNCLSSQETQETRVPSLGGEDALEDEMATHSSILAWKIPWTKEPGELQSVKVKPLIRVRLFATPWTVTCQAPQSMEFSREEYWCSLPFPFPGDLPDPEDQTQVSFITSRFFTV